VAWDLWTAPGPDAGEAPSDERADAEVRINANSDRARAFFKALLLFRLARILSEGKSEVKRKIRRRRLSDQVERRLTSGQEVRPLPVEDDVLQLAVDDDVHRR